VPEPLRNTPALPYHKEFNHFKDENTPWPLYLEKLNSLKSGPTVPKAVYEAEKPYFAKMIGNIAPNPQKYQLLPECRTCHSLFASWEDLKGHLDEIPRHARSYRQKTPNKIVRHGWMNGKAPCLTCGFVGEGIKKLALHIEKANHNGRWGLLPRWKEDNHAYNMRDRKRLQKAHPGYKYQPAWLHPTYYYG
jgi:hypothetical protein